LVFANILKERLEEDEGRIIYCLPYTSIIDQNFDEFEKIFKFGKKNKYEQRPARYLLKHHYLSMKNVKNRISKEEYSYKDYLDDKLFVESWESSMVVTTFVQFFHTVIGYKNSFLKKFHNIINSIVILDEVQNINPEYYYLLRKILAVLGEKFNTYFLLITATQPIILDSQTCRPVPLIKKQKYMEHNLFNRVVLKVIKGPQYLKDFQNDFCAKFAGENCLIVLNTKKAAVSLFQYIKKNTTDYEIFCLTTYLVPRDRKDKIDKIKNLLKDKKQIIVVATQLIEAGVDVSFKYVFRDFGPLDSIIQVAGRCNRNGEYGLLGGFMTLIMLADDNDKLYHKYIYKPIIAQHAAQTLEKKNTRTKIFISFLKVISVSLILKLKLKNYLQLYMTLIMTKKLNGKRQ
jgi:CRISPR-associated endonuclease/helicase Cas3